MSKSKHRNYYIGIVIAALIILAILIVSILAGIACTVGNAAERWRAVRKSVPADKGDRVRDRKDLQAFALPERLIPDKGQRIGQGNVFQLPAFVKNKVSDKGGGCRKRDFPQGVAV